MGLRPGWPLPDTSAPAALQVLTGHTSGVTGIAIAPDGTWLATTSNDHTTRIWNPTDGTCTTTLTGHTDWVTGVAVAPDGTWLATTSNDRTTRIWNPGGARIATLTGHTDWVTGVAVAPDGTWLATTSNDRTTRIWNPTDGTCTTTLTGHTREVTGIAIAPDGTWLATTSWDGTTQIWDYTVGARRVTFTGHTNRVTGTAIAPDGTWLATTSRDGTTQIWNTIADTHQALTDHTRSVTGAAIAPDGTWIATSSLEGTASRERKTTDVVAHNRSAWANEVARGNVWTRPVSHEVVERARRGEYAITLTATMQVPKEWLGDLAGKRVLCLASGGGQQGPLLAALGAVVTVFDNSPAQLASDTMVAEREGLSIATVQGDMRDLSAFDQESFDLIVHPISNCFVDDILPTWRECFRVLRPGGALLSGFNNPVLYIFDFETWDNEGRLEVKYRVPYSDTEQLLPDQLDKRLGEGGALEFGHSLTAQIGGQIAAGFVIAGFYEDNDGGGDLLDNHFDRYIATRALKPQSAQHRSDAQGLPC